MGIHLWNDLASSRESNGSSVHVPVTTPVFAMPVADLSYWMGKFVLKVRITTARINFQPEDASAMFPGSTLTNYNFNINIAK